MFLPEDTGEIIPALQTVDRTIGFFNNPATLLGRKMGTDRNAQYCLGYLFREGKCAPGKAGLGIRTRKMRRNRIMDQRANTRFGQFLLNRIALLMPHNV